MAATERAETPVAALKAVSNAAERQLRELRDRLREKLT